MRIVRSSALVTALVLLVLSGCALVNGGREPGDTGPGPDRSPRPSAAAGPPSADPLAIMITGETLEWDGSVGNYLHAADVTRPGRLWLRRTDDGRTAVAVMSGSIGGADTGTVLFATNTAALAGVSGISQSVVVSAIDVAPLVIDDQAAGRLVARVDPVRARSVTWLSFQVKPGGAPKQILDGSLDLTLTGAEVSGTLDLGGGDFLGGVTPRNRYRATISTP